MTKPKKKAAPAPASMTDVAHPGTSVPSDTSKSIINQRPMIKDPMVVEDSGKPAAEDKPLPSKKPAKATIKPVSDEAEDDAAKEDPAEAEPAGTEPAAEADTGAVPEPVADESDGESEEPEGGDDAKEDASGNAKKPKADAKDEAAAKAEAEAEAKLQKLVESKKYFLPLNAVEHRRSARFTAVGIVLALVLAVAWVDVALDAGLIHLGGVKPVTHLFSN